MSLACAASSVRAALDLDVTRVVKYAAYLSGLRPCWRAPRFAPVYALVTVPGGRASGPGAR